MTGKDWQELLRRASDLQRQGRVDQAIAAYEQLLSLNPSLPNSWYNLGFLQRHARQFKDALHSYERALSLGVSEPEEVYLNRAVILTDHLHRPDAAERELRKALEKNPIYVPGLLNLGNLREDMGDRSGAREAYGRAIAADPDNALALARLAGLSTSLELDASLAKQIKEKIGDPRTSLADQADLGFALARLLDAARHYDDAFEAARAANHASRTASGAQYDRRAVEQFVDRSISTFTEPVRLETIGDAPIFICGMFRSGSTLVESILGIHRRVRTGGELDALPLLARSIGGYPEAVARADAAQKGRWREAYWREIPPAPTAPQLLTDKRPDNFLHIGLMMSIFPGAKIVNTVRNPLDNLLSLYFLHLDPSMAYALDLIDAAHWYGQYQRLMAHWRSVYPSRIFDVDYDLLVREPRMVIGRLVDFLDLKWEDKLLDFHRQVATVKTASVWQVRQPIHARSSGRWCNYDAYLFDLKAALGLCQSK